MCACFEGATGKTLLDRSRHLSSLAGWPGLVTADAAAETIARYGEAQAKGGQAVDCCGDSRFYPPL